MENFCFNYDCAYGDCVTVLMDPEDKPSPYIQYMTLNGYAVMDNEFRVVIEPNDYWNIQYLGYGLFACEGSDDSGVILKDENYKL